MLYLAMLSKSWKKIRGWVYTKLELTFMFAFRTFRKLAFESAGREFSSQLMNSKSSKFPESTGFIITSFEPRLLQYAIPLIKQIRQSCDLPITLVINGNYDSPASNEILKQVYKEISELDRIYPLTFSKLHGCAALWNAGIRFADLDFSIVLNDDISITPENFVADLLVAVDNLTKSHLVTINSSWSHFLISRKMIQEIGWFDERFLGFGWEDGDYLLRYLRKRKSLPQTINLHSFVNIVDNSHDSQVTASWGKYSLFNREYYLFKYPEQRFQQNLDPEFGGLNESEKLSVGDWHSFRNDLYPMLVETDENLIAHEISNFFETRHDGNIRE